MHFLNNYFFISDHFLTISDAYGASTFSDFQNLP